MPASTSEINEANIPNMANVLQPMIEPVPQDHAEALGRALRLRHDRHRLQHQGDLADEEAKEKGVEPAVRQEICQGKIGGYDDMTTRVWYAALPVRPGPQRHQGHGRRLGQGARDPRPGQEVLELRRRADGPAVQGRDRGHRRLVGPRRRAAAAGRTRSAISIRPAPMPGWRTCWSSRARRWPSARS